MRKRYMRRRLEQGALQERKEERAAFRPLFYCLGPDRAYRPVFRTREQGAVPGNS
ncbi:MAG TPA: hypothetical protein PK213_02420 [Deltaproteobacteria bacterium]|nr:hypothetical protein [Deltaproteobacteria bacterium]